MKQVVQKVVITSVHAFASAVLISVSLRWLALARRSLRKWRAG
jgi:hypothetical protein